jgi:molecular chaperone GrpE
MADDMDRPDKKQAGGEEQDAHVELAASELGHPKPTGDEGARTESNAPNAATLEARIADLTDRLLRRHAEMDNMRKRSERDKEAIAKYAICKFAGEVLSLGDNLRRAIAAVPAGAAEEDPALKALIDGVALTEREFLNVLDRNGVKRIDPVGQPFDPHQHQAMTEIEDRDLPAGTIVQVYQPGYVLDDRLLRPAMVVVAKGGFTSATRRTDPGTAAPRAVKLNSSAAELVAIVGGTFA